QLPPARHAFLGRLEEGAVLMMLELLQKYPENPSRIPDERGVDGIAKANAFGIKFYLHAPGFSGRRIILDVWKACADHQQGVARFERVLRGTGSEQSASPRRIRIIVRHDALAEKWLDDRRAQPLRDRKNFLPRV